MMLVGFFSLKEVFHERVKTYKTWKEAEATLTKKRENKVKLEIARKMDKIPQADDEISEVQISTFWHYVASLKKERNHNAHESLF